MKLQLRNLTDKGRARIALTFFDPRRASFGVEEVIASGLRTMEECLRTMPQIFCDDIKPAAFRQFMAEQPSRKKSETGNFQKFRDALATFTELAAAELLKTPQHGDRDGSHDAGEGMKTPTHPSISAVSNGKPKSTQEKA